MTETAILSVSETHRLDALEGVIERGKAAFVEVGEALLEIRDRRLYRESHGTFDDYCRERWDFARSTAYQFIDAARVVSAMADIPVPAPSSERVARELAPVLREGARARRSHRRLPLRRRDHAARRPRLPRRRRVVTMEAVLPVLRVVRPEAAVDASMPAIPPSSAGIVDAAPAAASPTTTDSVPVVEGRPTHALRRVVAEIVAEVAELDAAIAAGECGEVRLALYVGQVAAYRNVLVLLRDATGVEQ